MDRKITFYSDASHNYMILECPAQLKENYQYRMLAANQIQGLLECSSRTIDHQDYLYYDISSRQSLADLFDRLPVRGQELQVILESLIRLEESLTEYLLDTVHLLTDPAAVYLDFRMQSCWFAYYPGEEASSDWEAFFSFLADRVDGSDKQTAALIYRLCMMAEKPGFRLRPEVLRELGMQIGPEPGRAACGNRLLSGGASELSGRNPGRDSLRQRGLPDPGNTGYEKRLYASEEMFSGRERLSDREGYPGAEMVSGRGMVSDREGRTDISQGEGFSRMQARRKNPDQWNEWKDPDAEEEKMSKRSAGNRLWMPVLSFIFLAAGVLLLLLDKWMELEERMLLLSRAFGGLLLAACIFLTGLWIYNRHAEKKAGSAQKEEEVQLQKTEPWEFSSEESPFFSEQGSRLQGYGISGSGSYSFEDGAGAGTVAAVSSQENAMRTGRYRDSMAQSGGTGGPFPNRSDGQGLYGSLRSVYPSGGTSGGTLTSASVAETSLLSQDSGTAAGLYGTGNYRGEQIRLSDLPCVVGKMEGYVDQVLNDSTVSRMHARFSLDRDGKMNVRDLNSTNGTWLNGERLQPNETRELVPGDHLRLGRMEFVFR